MNKPVEDRARQQNYQIRRREEGMCPRCNDERLDINARTGRYYRFGPNCRKLVAEEQKRLMRERRRGG
jgi:hypothetical protein